MKKKWTVGQSAYAKYVLIPTGEKKTFMTDRFIEDFLELPDSTKNFFCGWCEKGGLMCVDTEDKKSKYESDLKILARHDFCWCYQKNQNIHTPVYGLNFWIFKTK